MHENVAHQLIAEPRRPAHGVADAYDAVGRDSARKEHLLGHQ